MEEVFVRNITSYKITQMTYLIVIVLLAVVGFISYKIGVGNGFFRGVQTERESQTNIVVSKKDAAQVTEAAPKTKTVRLVITAKPKTAKKPAKKATKKSK